MPSLAPTTASPAQYAKLASTLPPLLLNFLRRHPPGSYSSTPSTPLAPGTPTTTQPSVPASSLTGVSASLASSNPFLPFRNPLTSKWRPAQYSHRHQAALYKLAKTHGVLSLLPQESPKNPALKLARREEQGSRVRGTGAGQKVKGKAWERRLPGKLEARERAMEGMAGLIKEWKSKGHGRGWRRWPK